MTSKALEYVVLFSQNSKAAVGLRQAADPQPLYCNFLAKIYQLDLRKSCEFMA